MTFDAMIAMIAQNIRGGSTERAAEINRLGREHYQELAQQKQLLEDLLAVVNERLERFQVYMPRQDTAMPRIVQQGPRRESDERNKAQG